MIRFSKAPYIFFVLVLTFFGKKMLAQEHSIRISYGAVDMALNQPSLGISLDFQTKSKIGFNTSLFYGRKRETERVQNITNFQSVGVVGQFNVVPTDKMIDSLLINKEPSSGSKYVYNTHHYLLSAGVSYKINWNERLVSEPGIYLGIRIDSYQDVSLVGQYQYNNQFSSSTSFPTFIQIEKRAVASIRGGVRTSLAYKLSQSTLIGIAFQGDISLQENFYFGVGLIELKTTF
ncbi:MAG: hypothetical protein AB8F78_11560 [Saprospiraceae bacterium]